MSPIFFTLENKRPLKITPHTRVYMDGHPILSYNYSVFLDDKKNGQGDAHQSQMTDPDYLGFITFEQPGHIFTYTAGNGTTLTPDEVEEVIEYIGTIRDNPAMWKSMGQV